MIDLSHLSEEEQEKIVEVLKRDAVLRKADEDRIKRLQKTTRDKAKLKYLTGEWFYQTKSQRLRDRIHGSDIIRAAMRQRRPMTIFEITQIWAERPSFVNSEIQDIFVPAELSGLIEEPPAQSTEDRVSVSVSPDVVRDDVFEDLQSPPKSRANPFNSVLSWSEDSEVPGEHLTNWEAAQITASEADLLPPSKNHKDSPAKMNSEDGGTLETVLPEMAPLPKKRTILYPRLDSAPDRGESFPKWSSVQVERSRVSAAPRGILKRSSSCSSADFPVFCCDRDDGGCSGSTDTQKVQQPEGNNRPAQRSESIHSLDRKQVRFSTPVMSEKEEGPTLLGDGELGDYGLLDIQCETFTDEEGGASRFGKSSFMGESINDLAHSRAASKFQKEGREYSLTMTVAESIPRKVTTPPTSESQNSMLESKWQEVDTGEAKHSGGETVKRGQDVGPPQNPGGQHATESSTQWSEDQKGKPVHAEDQRCGPFSRPAEQSNGLAEDQRGPVAQVLEGFSWSPDGSEQYDKRTHQRDVQEAAEEFGILEDAASENKVIETTDFSWAHSVKAESKKPEREPSEKKVKGAEGSDTEEEILDKDTQMTGGSILMKYPVFSLYTDATTQKELHNIASENELRPGTEGKLESQYETQGKIASLSHPVIGEAHLATKQKDIYDVESYQRLAILKSFWEKGSCGSSILINKTGKNSRRKETMNEFADRSKVTSVKLSESNIDLCKVGQELPCWIGETSPAPETMKNDDGHYTLHFKGRKESESHVLEADIKRNSIDSANNNKISEQSGSLFQKESYLNPGIDSSDLKESSPYFESRNMLENRNEENIYIAEPTIISEEEAKGLNSDIQLGHQGEQFSSQHNSLTASRQTGRQQDDGAGKINNLTSFWKKGRCGPEVIVGKQKESQETKVNQVPEATPRNAEKQLVTSGSVQRTETIELDKGCDSRSSLQSIKEQAGKESEDQSAINTLYKNIDEIKGTVPSVKTELPSTEDVPQCPRSTYSSQETAHAFQQLSQLLVVEPSPVCPPQIPPRCPIKSKTKICSSNSHSVDVCPPIRELMKRDQKEIPPVQQKIHSPEEKQWEPRVAKMAFETKGIFTMGRLAHGQHSRLPQLWKDIEKSPAGEPVAPQFLVSQNDKESKPELPRRTSIGTLNVRQAHQSIGSNELNEGTQASPEVYRLMYEGRHPSSRRASEGQLSRVSEEAERRHPLACSLISQGYPHDLGLPKSAHINDWRVPAIERSGKSSNGHPPTTPEADLGVLPEPVQTNTLTGPQEVSDHPRNRKGSEGHGTKDTTDSSRTNTPKTWSTSRASSDCRAGCDESESPIQALKQISARPVAVSKSLEDVTSQQTISPVSMSPSSTFSEREQMKKRCASMPAFLHGEKNGRDSESDSESSFAIGGRNSSASTNFSTSSGMASMSSASSSLMSIYSLEYENVDVKGSIQFALSYVLKLGELHIFVVRCRDLAIADTKKNRSDPYVKSYLLPDKSKLGKKKTTVKKKTLNPIYNEILRYKIDMETLKSQTLNLSVWHHNSFGRNSFLGEVDFEFSEWDLRNTHMNDFTLKAKSPSCLQPADHRGEIRLAMRFLQQSSLGKRTPKNGLVQIFVKECTNLPLIRGAPIDPFVKCYVLPDTNRKSRQKSRVLRRTANPVFNHTMVYDGFTAEDLREACVELTVWDHDRLNNHFVGGVRLSLGTGRSYGTNVDWMDSNPAEAMLWEKMMDSHNEWAEDVLPLRMLKMAHSMSK